MLGKILATTKLARNGNSPRSARLTMNDSVRALLDADVGDTIGYRLENGRIYIEKVRS
jgi:hypothetical protein